MKKGTTETKVPSTHKSPNVVPTACTRLPPVTGCSLPINLPYILSIYLSTVLEVVRKVFVWLPV